MSTVAVTQAPTNHDPPPKPKRTEEALRIIEEYAAHLRETIERLRAETRLNAMAAPYALKPRMILALLGAH